MSKSKGVIPANNRSNMQNANKGSDVVNRQYSQVHSKRVAQLNTNNKGNH